MSGDLFRKHMGELGSYFKTSLTDDQKYQYQKTLQFIPGIALQDIAESLISERRPTPGNFPTINEIKRAWYEWRKMHPEKVERKQTQPIPCDSCSSTGLISFKGPIPLAESGLRLYDFKPTLTCICGECENWKRHVGNIDGDRRYTKQYILDQGWELWPFTEHRKKYRNIKDMAYDVGEKVKDNFEADDFSDPRFNERRQVLRDQAIELIQDEVPF